jgi:dihydrofolate reductase
MLNIKLIIAIDRNGVMGINNKLPWRLSDDLKEFKKETLNSPLIMGAKTFLSLPGILPNREHIVLSTSLDGDENKSVFTSIKHAIEYVKDLGEDKSMQKAYIIGGANIIKQFAQLNMFDELIITHVDAEVDGDVALDFDCLKLDSWEIYKRTKYKANEKNQYDFEVCRYIKKKKRFY